MEDGGCWGPVKQKAGRKLTNARALTFIHFDHLCFTTYIQNGKKVDFFVSTIYKDGGAGRS